MAEQEKANLLNDVLMKASILVVDDMALMRKMISMTLARAGFTDIIEADDGDVALEMIKEKSPDIVILDLNMPRLSGYEVCRELRSNPKTADLPVLVQSASETPEERVKVFEAGATDFVSKPINQPEMLARVSMHLENRFLIRDLSAFRKRIAAELDMARDMQNSLLPDAETLAGVSALANVGISSTYQASSELGGDIWGTWQIDEHRFGVHVMDVTGHGVASALSTIRIDSATRRLRSQSKNPEEFIKTLNKELVENFPTGQFATMFYGVYCSQTRILRYCGAGSPPPLLVASGAIAELDSAGLPLGISERADYPEKEISIPENASLVLYSDVLIEAKDNKGEMIGVDGFKDRVLSANYGQGSIHDELLAWVRSEFGEGPLPDDLTLVELRFDRV